ncbi:MAG: class I SAM-dependent methyltransferase [Gemmatimonadetes bacterium]|nr:class I SAM-dependent methyltransferase [Gemmatimonadota bacterium]
MDSRPEPPRVTIGDPPGPIDRLYYETTGYFEGGGRHLLDPESTFQRYRIREVLRLCGPHSGDRVVDLGCGWGTLAFVLARTAARVVGVDFAAAALEFCRRRLAAGPVRSLGTGLGPNIGPRPDFIQADAGNTGLRGGSWDLVVAADLVEHLYPNDTRRVYEEARRLLRPGGRLVVWTPNPGHLLERLRALHILRPDPTHVDYKTLNRVIRELREVGFTIEVAEYVPSHLPFLRTVERWSQGFVPVLRRRVGVVGVRSNGGRSG